MATRVLPGAAAGWLGLHLLVYLWVVRADHGDVAGWYVVLETSALLACVAAAGGVARARTAVAALVLTGLATLAGLLSIGLLLLPADLALAVALLGRAAPRRRPASLDESAAHPATR